jgi:CBS domain-containing protein
MKIGDVLKRKGSGVVTMRSDSTIDTVVRRMRLERIGAVIISPDGKSVIGILSERDILHALAEHGTALLALKAEDLMTREVVTCSREDTLQSVMVKMTQRRIRHLPVVEQGQLAGIVSIGDAVKSRLEEVELEANVLRDSYLATH